MGIEMITEEFSEMQERLKRGSHKAGYRYVTGELSKVQQELEDEVETDEDQEGGSDYTPSIRPSQERSRRRSI